MATFTKIRCIDIDDFGTFQALVNVDDVSIVTPFENSDDCSEIVLSNGDGYLADYPFNETVDIILKAKENKQ